MSNQFAIESPTILVIIGPQSKMEQFILPYELIQKEVRNVYPPYVASLYDKIFIVKADQTPQIRALNLISMQFKLKINFAEFLPFQPIKSQMPICNKEAKNLKLVSNYYFKCHDCLLIPGAMYCKDCFVDSEHIGHTYEKLPLSNEGYCDCGNADIIRESGFCKKHRGFEKSIKIQIPEQVFAEFTLTLQILFTWFQQLKTCHFGMSVCFARFLVNYILFLTDESLYYCNLLGFAIFKQFSLKDLSKGEQPANEYNGTTIFQIIMSYYAHRQLPSIFQQLLMRVFAVKQAKIKMLGQMIKIWNRNFHFETGGYANILIQLLVSSETSLKVIRQQKLVLTQKKYVINEGQFLKLMQIMLQLQQKFSFQYFSEFFVQEKFIRVRFLDQIEYKIQKPGRHIVQVIDLYIEIENSYFNVILEILKVFLLNIQNQLNSDKYMNENNSECELKQTQQKAIEGLIGPMTLGYFKILQCQIHSYKNNKIFLTNHRLFAFCIFVYFGRRLQNINAERMMQLLQVNKVDMLKFLVKATIQVLICVWEFSVNCCRTTYFSNYMPLYLLGGKTLLNYDMLFLRIAIILLNQLQFPFSQIIVQLFRRKFAEIQVHFQPKVKEAQIKQFYFVLNAFLSLLTEITVSVKQQIAIASQIGDKQAQKEQTAFYLKSFLSYKEEYTDKQLQNFSQTFLGKRFNHEKIRSLSEYNPKTKKFKFILGRLNELFDFRFHASLAKRSSFPSDFIDQRRSLRPPKLFKICQLIRDKIFDEGFFQFLFQLNKRRANGHESAQSSEGFVYQLSKILLLKGINKKSEGQIKGLLIKQFNYNSSKYEVDTFQSVKQILEFKSEKNIQESSQNKQEKNKRKLLINQIKMNKIQQIKQKQRKAKLNFIKQSQKQQEKEQKGQNFGFQNAECLLCKQRNQEKTMCFIGRFNYSNKISFLFKIKKQFFNMHGCGHLIHFECLRNSHENKNRFFCPLCKSYANVLIPCRFQYARCSQSKDPQKLSMILSIYFEIVEIVSEIKRFRISNSRSNVIASTAPLTQMASVFVQILGYKAFRNPMQFFRNIQFYRSYIDFIKNYLYLAQEQVAFSLKSDIKAGQYQTEKLVQNAMLQQENMNYPFSEARQFVFSYIIQAKQKKIEQFKMNLFAKEYLNLFQKANEDEKIQNDALFAIKAFTYALVSSETIFISQKANENLKKAAIFSEENLKSKFAKLPKDIPSSLKLRDQRIISQGCCKSHSQFICMLCQISVCLQCRTLQLHSFQYHAGNSFYFNLFSSGILIHVQNLTINHPSIYSNSYGDSWEPNKGKSMDFKLNEQQLGKYFKEMLDYQFQQKTLKRYLDLRQNLEIIFGQ